MKAPDIKLHYPSGAKALEITGIDATFMEYLQLGPAFLNITFDQVPKLQPLINDFYDIYQKIKKMS